jgi:NIMA (never in mitosis gene a)-related kinase 1/4/5
MENYTPSAGKNGQEKFREFDIQTKLGQGSFGVVYKVRRKTDNQIYVLKQIDTSRMSKAQRNESAKEAMLMERLTNSYIVQMYDSFTTDKKINIVMELCENGDLGLHLKRQQGRNLSETKVWKFFIEMCLGIQYLHANRILHRDIKTINMFLAKGDVIKIGDLGVARELNQTANMAHTVVGTPYYLSPELCEEKPYNNKSDIWSLGCVLYELCTLRHPFEAQNQGALILKILRGKFNPLPSIYSKSLHEMVDRLLIKDYRKRPAIDEILKLPAMSERMARMNYEVPSFESLKMAAKR